jgi:putative phosphoribosyl transferase
MRPQSTGQPTSPPRVVDAPREARVAERLVRITPLALHGALHLPAEATGIVLLALHPGCAMAPAVRQRLLAGFHAAGLATLAVDALLPDEIGSRFRAFDRPLIARRIGFVLDWLASRPATRDLPVGLFAVGSGGSDALVAAAQDDRIAALALADGRLDLAGSAAARVTAPTLLMAAEGDAVIAGINRRVHAAMHGERALVLLQGQARACGTAAALDVIVALSCDWFCCHLQRPVPPRRDRTGDCIAATLQ